MKYVSWAVGLLFLGVIFTQTHLGWRRPIETGPTSFAQRPRRHMVSFPSRQLRLKRVAALLGMPHGHLRKTADNQFDIPRSILVDKSTNSTLSAPSIYLVPRFVQGKADGLKIYRLRENSIFTQIGLRNGDVIQSVNKNDLSIEKLLDISAKLADQNDFVLEIERKGVRMKLFYHLTDD